MLALLFPTFSLNANIQTIFKNKILVLHKKEKFVILYEQPQSNSRIQVASAT